jgi:hypothetical protein
MSVGSAKDPIAAVMGMMGTAPTCATCFMGCASKTGAEQQACAMACAAGGRRQSQRAPDAEYRIGKGDACDDESATKVYDLRPIDALPDQDTVREAAAVFNTAAKDGVSGRILFRQPNMSSPTSITVVLSTASNATRKMQTYHVHIKPVLDASFYGGACSAAAVGGHYNPAFVAGACNPTDMSTCEVGDLAGKHGDIATVNGAFSQLYDDAQIQLSGPQRAQFSEPTHHPGAATFDLQTAHSIRTVCFCFRVVACPRFLTVPRSFVLLCPTRVALSAVPLLSTTPQGLGGSVRPSTKFEPELRRGHGSKVWSRPQRLLVVLLRLASTHNHARWAT